MVNFLDTQSDAQRFAALLADYDRRLQALERTTQAGHTSIEGGQSLDIYDEEGVLKGSVGVQPDGGVALVPVNTSPPPTPMPPAVESVLAGLLIGWDGTWDDSYTTPSDFALLQVHVGPTADFTPDVTTQVATITSPLGGTVTVAIDGYDPVWVRLVAANTAAVAGPPSAAVEGAPRQAVPQDLIDGIVTETKLADEAVSQAKVKLGAIGADQLALGAGNLAPDPSFEGPLTAQLVASQPDWTLVTPGNDSGTAVSVNATAAATTWKRLDLATLPVLPRERHFLALDAKVSQDYDGIAARLVLRYLDSDGNLLGYGTTSATPTPGGDWVRGTGQAQAPAGTAAAVLCLEGTQASKGSATFDNIELRTVVAAGMVVAGSISANELAVNSVTADKIVALGVTAQKIAALAITTDKLSALSVTADKLAVNSVTASKILAGSIDATHIKAGSLTADRLALGTDGNVIADPSFEGAVSDQRVAGQTYWSIATPGNGTPRALQVNAANPTAITRTLTLATLPAVPGQKLYLAMDYLASADWNGSRISIYGQWLDAAGTILAYSTVTTGDGSAVKGSWQTLTGVPDEAAPTGTTQFRVACSTVNSSTGTVQYDNASCRVVLASGFAGARAEISPAGLLLYDDSGEEAVALVSGRPNYLTFSTDGTPVATIDQEGGAGFQRMAIADTFTIGGTDWNDYLAQLPRGILAIDYQATTKTASGTEMGFVELACQIDATRMYRFVFAARANPSVAGGELQVRLRDGGTGTPKITSTQRYVAVHHMALGNSFTARMEHVTPGTTLGAGNHRFLITFTNALAPSGQTCTMTGATDNLGYFYIEDIGPLIPETGQYNDGGGTAAPPVQKYTKTYAASWSGSYANRGSYNSYYGNKCVQGYYSSNNGTQAALIGFPAALGTDLSGATIQKAEVYLYFEHWYANSGGKAVIKAHGLTSRPSSFSSDSQSMSVSFARNEGKWVDITSVFDSTKWRGIALDPNSTSSTYYGIARGVGETNPPQLRVTYTK
ncbi:hypothetical protein ABZ352_18570 [Streptomyces griseofuscus]|uniref:hypothetical protein n=1 Tax=Streptomyces griseofuscus TaxID=146922 RepID=UPI0033EE6264